MKNSQSVKNSQCIKLPWKPRRLPEPREGLARGLWFADFQPRGRNRTVSNKCLASSPASLSHRVTWFKGRSTSLPLGWLPLPSWKTERSSRVLSVTQPEGSAEPCGAHTGVGARRGGVGKRMFSCCSVSHPACGKQEFMAEWMTIKTPGQKRFSCVLRLPHFRKLRHT